MVYKVWLVLCWF